jgi:hypothetical protein
MALVCPICKSSTQDLPRTGDARGFYSTIHGHFKVAEASLLNYYTRAEWEVALRAAKLCTTDGFALSPHTYRFLGRHPLGCRKQRG